MLTSAGVRKGEDSKYKDSLVGKEIYQEIDRNKRWFAYRRIPGKVQILRKETKYFKNVKIFNGVC